MAATEANLVGDVLLSSSFVTYAGAFNAELRHELAADHWLPDIQRRAIPASAGVGPLDMLCDETLKARGAGLAALQGSRQAAAGPHREDSGEPCSAAD